MGGVLLGKEVECGGAKRSIRAVVGDGWAASAGVSARNLEDVQLFTESRDSYVDAAIRTGRRGGRYPYDFFISSAAN
ncbi:hypothetical protein HLK59_47635, partial [Streptomyces sp. S3(2020)]|nr:hypothetical protein [Streptomyces sp. S3(2020)]